MASSLVIRVLDWKSRRSRFKSSPLSLDGFVFDGPKHNFLRFINSKRASLPSNGIFNKFLFKICLLISVSLVSTPDLHLPIKCYIYYFKLSFLTWLNFSKIWHLFYMKGPLLRAKIWNVSLIRVKHFNLSCVIIILFAGDNRVLAPVIHVWTEELVLPSTRTTTITAYVL